MLYRRRRFGRFFGAIIAIGYRVPINEVADCRGAHIT